MSVKYTNIDEIADSYLNGNHQHVFRTMLPNSPYGVGDLFENSIDRLGMTKYKMILFVRRVPKSEVDGEMDVKYTSIDEIADSYLNGNHQHVFKTMLPNSPYGVGDLFENSIDRLGLTKYEIVLFVKQAEAAGLFLQEEGMYTSKISICNQ